MQAQTKRARLVQALGATDLFQFLTRVLIDPSAR